MKNRIQLFIIVLITSLPFLSYAQFSVGILTAPVSAITTTKILASIGVELKFSPTTSMVLEHSIPILKIKGAHYNEKATSFCVELRKYKSAKIQNGNQKYLAITFRSNTESYTLENNNYLAGGYNKIVFDYAKVNSLVNSISIKLGLQKIFKKHFILDLNFGVGLNNKTVIYEDVIIASPPYPRDNPWLLNLYPYDYVPAFAPQPDNIAKSHNYMGLSISIRVGYLFSR